MLLRACIVVFLLVLSGGCATIPRGVTVVGSERETIIILFKDMVLRQADCPRAIDTDVTVGVENFFYSGTISGYLQAMSPAFLRFEGVNPLGLTEIILSTNGAEFYYLVVREQKGYQGSLTAQKSRKYLTEQIVSSINFFWLIGRLGDGGFEVLEIETDPDGKGDWLYIKRGDSPAREKILFSSEHRRVVRHLLLSDAGKVLADLTYEYQGPSITTQPESKLGLLHECSLPVKTRVAGNGNGTITINFNTSYPTDGFAEGHFRFNFPTGFEVDFIE